jgi:two-component system, OmpR family, response regulator
MTANAATGRGSQPARVDSNEVGRVADGRFEAADGKVGPERRKPVCVVVEDDLTMRHLVMNYLEEHDIRAVAASRRDEVSAFLARGESDLVILDLRLGQEDGLDLLREIRSHSDIPIIITTGHRRDEIDRVVGLELGADDYITKPFGRRNFWPASGRCCGGARPATPRLCGIPNEAAAGSAAGCSIGAAGG